MFEIKNWKLLSEPFDALDQGTQCTANMVSIIYPVARPLQEGTI